MTFILNNLHVLRGVLNQDLYKKIIKHSDFILCCLNSNLDRIAEERFLVAELPITTSEERAVVTALAAAQTLSNACRYRVLNKKVTSLKRELKMNEYKIKNQPGNKTANDCVDDYEDLVTKAVKATIDVWKEMIKQYKFERALCYSVMTFNCKYLLNIIDIDKESAI